MIERRRFRWRGPQPSGDGELIANARDDLFPLTPTSEAPAAQTRTNWAAVLPSSIPFAWEMDHGGEEELRD